MILEVKKKGLLVVVLMGGFVVLGGYWVLMLGDVIFVELGMIMGLIGIFGIILLFENMLVKIGVIIDGVKIMLLLG